MFLPFAYLFTESTGFVGHKKGIIARAYETFTVFSLLATVVLGITYVLSAVMDPDKIGFLSLLSMFINNQVSINLIVSLLSNKTLEYLLKYFQI